MNVPAFSQAWMRAVPCGTVTDTPSTSKVMSDCLLAVELRQRVELAEGIRRAAKDATLGVLRSMLDISRM